MSFYDAEIDRLHEELARIYRLGNLTPEEYLRAQGLWARIERLEATKVLMLSKGGAQ